MCALLIPMDRRRHEGWTRILFIPVSYFFEPGRRIVFP